MSKKRNDAMALSYRRPFCLWSEFNIERANASECFLSGFLVMTCLCLCGSKHKIIMELGTWNPTLVQYKRFSPVFHSISTTYQWKLYRLLRYRVSVTLHYSWGKLSFVFYSILVVFICSTQNLVWLLNEWPS